jgi:hypothetical protein
MKKTISVLMTVILLLPIFAVVLSNAETYIPSRTINLVFDDSSSMITPDNVNYVDTWCQAKYAVEVFAGMLGENETLNIYYMSDYSDGTTTAAPRLTLAGSADAAVTEGNVKKVHDLITNALDTPFGAVKKAYEDLKKADTDDKWLVVLTDGAFENIENSDVENYFNSCTSDGKTSVMMLSIGSNAAQITSNPDKRIYSEKAENSAEILTKITSICNRIFQSNALAINEANEITFNVPMSSLIVFAQGKEAKIEGISDASGQTVNATSNVHVEYSKTATTNKKYSGDKVVVDNNLNGYVATYNMDFSAGTYKINVSGADNIQVYYKPNVSIAAYLYNGNNEEVTSMENLISGEYRVEFGFVNAANGEKITDTSLLGNIAFEASVANTPTDGETLQSQVKSGDTVTIKEGTLDIDVTARFLEYNTVQTKLSYSVYTKNNLVFSLEQKPTYTLTTDGFSNPNDALVLSVKIDDGNGPVELSEEQWNLLENTKITTTADLGEFRVEKSDEIGKYYVYPTLKDGSPLKTAGGTVPIKAEGSFEQGLSTAEGVLEGNFEINNTITSAQRFEEWLKENWIKLTIALLLLLLVLGYIPPFKKYFSRKLKKRPTIEWRAERIGNRNNVTHGSYKRSVISTLIPYKAETGSITVSPSPNKKTLKVRAAGSSGLYITNAKVFAGKENITFNGVMIPEGKTKYRISSGSSISLSTNDYTYTCYLNR